MPRGILPRWNAAVETVHRIEETRGELDYMIDGAVIKITDFATREALGYTDKFPRWAVAYKFEAEEQLTTRWKRWTWQVGRTGKLTPPGHRHAGGAGGRDRQAGHAEQLRTTSCASG